MVGLEACVTSLGPASKTMFLSPIGRATVPAPPGCPDALASGALSDRQRQQLRVTFRVSWERRNRAFNDGNRSTRSGKKLLLRPQP
jgi:hypothetical protein